MVYKQQQLLCVCFLGLDCGGARKLFELNFVCYCMEGMYNIFWGGEGLASSTPGYHLFAKWPKRMNKMAKVLCSLVRKCTRQSRLSFLHWTDSSSGGDVFRWRRFWASPTPADWSGKGGAVVLSFKCSLHWCVCVVLICLVFLVSILCLFMSLLSQITGSNVACLHLVKSLLQLQCLPAVMHVMLCCLQ